MSRGQKSLKYLFNPRSIAVIGASRNPEKVGGAVLESLIKGGYKGKLFAVNPEAEEVQGVKSYKVIKFLKSRIDLAVIIVPAQAVKDVLFQCGEEGVKAAIVISSGFSETGNEGKKLENEISEVAQKFGIALLGPNCLGIINTENNLNASFVSSSPKKGEIALVSQSGAIISSLIDWGSENNMGFSKIASLGNKASIDETDILEYLAQDKQTKVIALYLETISRGKEFIEMARKVSLKKPIIALKTGTSRIGQAASQSHTGALATEDRVIDAALRKSGIIRVFNTEDLLRVSQLLSFRKDIARKIFVVSNAGGLAVSSADIASSQNLKFAQINDLDKKNIHKIIPKFLAVNNPLDIGGDAKSDRYKKVLDIVCRGKKSFAPTILAIITPQKMTDFKNIAEDIVRFNKKGASILPILAGGEKTREARKTLIENKIPVYDFPEQALHILDIIDDSCKKISPNPHKISIPEKDFFNIKNIIHKYSREWIPLDETMKIAESAGIPIAESAPIKERNDIDYAIKNIKFPIVVKTSAAEVIHKAKAGQVAAGIDSRKELLKALGRIKKPIVQHQEKKDIELIIGAKRDDNFGTMLVFGTGGIMANEINQAKFYMIPIGTKEAEEIIEKCPMKNLFSQPVKSELVKIIISLQKLMMNFSQVLEVDLNPVMINFTDEKVVCPDVKIKVQ